MKYLSSYIFVLMLMSACSTSPESVILAYEREHNAHDVESALSFLTDDIIFDFQGVWVKRGKDALRELEEWDAALNSNLKVTLVRESQDSTYCSVVESNDWFRAIGLEQITHDPVIFITREGKISKIIAAPSMESGPLIMAAMKDISDWSSVVGDTSLSFLIKDGEFLYSKETAARWLVLFQKWNAYKTGQKEPE